MNANRLVAMANDIAAFFASESDPAAAAAGVANHLTRFWEPRMRKQIVEYYRAGGSGLSEVAAAGVGQLVAGSGQPATD
jgi:formate dehydrogenase subunit delta